MLMENPSTYKWWFSSSLFGHNRVSFHPTLWDLPTWQAVETTLAVEIARFHISIAHMDLVPFKRYDMVDGTINWCRISSITVFHLFDSFPCVLYSSRTYLDNGPSLTTSLDVHVSHVKMRKKKHPHVYSNYAYICVCIYIYIIHAHMCVCEHVRNCM